MHFDYRIKYLFAIPICNVSDGHTSFMALDFTCASPCQIPHIGNNGTGGAGSIHMGLYHRNTLTHAFDNQSMCTRVASKQPFR